LRGLIGDWVSSFVPPTIDCAALRASGGLPVQVPAGQERSCVMMFGRNLLRANGMTIADLAEMGLSRYVNRPVVDRTNLPGPFQFSVKWAADTNPDGISIFTAVQEQLGSSSNQRPDPLRLLW
jgi:uncharacterized protein (TIGR03435 family)